MVERHSCKYCMGVFYYIGLFAITDKIINSDDRGLKGLAKTFLSVYGKEVFAFYGKGSIITKSSPFSYYGLKIHLTKIRRIPGETLNDIKILGKAVAFQSDVE